MESVKPPLCTISTLTLPQPANTTVSYRAKMIYIVKVSEDNGNSSEFMANPMIVFEYLRNSQIYI